MTGTEPPANPTLTAPASASPVSLDLPVRPLFSQRTRRSTMICLCLALVPWLTLVLGLLRKLQ
ncbi:MAG: hypothetical protein QM778_15705 [Myxococcales bacterium]